MFHFSPPNPLRVYFAFAFETSAFGNRFSSALSPCLLCANHLLLKMLPWNNCVSSELELLAFTYGFFVLGRGDVMDRHKAMPDLWAVDQKLLHVSCHMDKGMLEGGKLLAAENNFMKHSLKWQPLRTRVLTRIPEEFGDYIDIKSIHFSLLIIIRILEKLFSFVHFIAYDLVSSFQIPSHNCCHKLLLNPGRYCLKALPV